MYIAVLHACTRIKECLLTFQQRSTMAVSKWWAMRIMTANRSTALVHVTCPYSKAHRTDSERIRLGWWISSIVDIRCTRSAFERFYAASIC